MNKIFKEFKRRRFIEAWLCNKIMEFYKPYFKNKILKKIEIKLIDIGNTLLIISIPFNKNTYNEFEKQFERENNLKINNIIEGGKEKCQN